MPMNGRVCELLSKQSYEIHKPVLRPMSDLTKIELWDAGFNSHIDYLTHEMQNPLNKGWSVLKAPYNMVAYLFKHHFDVFGLIEKGLAISIHDAK